MATEMKKENKIKGWIFLSEGEQPFFQKKRPTKKELEMCERFYTKIYPCIISFIKK